MRIEAWSSALNATIAAWRGRTFAWGTDDCVHLAGDCVLAVTGLDPLTDLRGTYTSERGAWRALKRAGYATLAEAVDRRVGNACAPGFAHRGDLVLFDGIHGLALGVCVGPQVVAITSAGLAFEPRSIAVAAWKL